MMPHGLRALRNARFAAGVFVLSAWLGGCALVVPQTDALHAEWPARLPDSVELKDVPFFPQSEYQCGPAALATVLVHDGVATTPEKLAKEVYLPAREGSLQVEMLAAPRRHGLVSYQLAPKYEDLLREVAAGNPVIVLQDYGMWPLSVWHYAVVVGYEHHKGEAILRSGDKQRLTLPFPVLEFTWRSGDYWAMVALPPDRIPATATEKDYVQSVVALARTGNTQAAKVAYETFLKRWPDDLVAEIGLADTYYSLHDLAGAEAVLRRAAAHHPDSVAVLNNLAQVLSDQRKNDEALKLAQRAVSLGGPYAAEAGKTRDLILQRMKATN